MKAARRLAAGVIAAARSAPIESHSPAPAMKHVRAFRPLRRRAYESAKRRAGVVALAGGAPQVPSGYMLKRLT